MRNSLDLSEVRACLKNIFLLWMKRSSKTKLSRARARGYLGNKLFFCHAAVVSAANDACEGISMPRNELEKSDTGNGILESVGHHAGPQALAQVRQNAEENSKDADGNHHSRALISVRQAKDDS